MLKIGTFRWLVLVLAAGSAGLLAWAAHRERPWPANDARTHVVAGGYLGLKHCTRPEKMKDFSTHSVPVIM